MNLLRSLADIFSYDVVRQSKDVFIERHLHNLFKHHRIDCVIDVGANRGQYAGSLRNMGYKGEIHSFEPTTRAYQELQSRSLNDARWHIYQLAIGRHGDNMEINIAAYDDLSSFLKASQYSTDTFQHKSRITGTEMVEIKRLDEVFSDGMDNHRIHLKMDTQGYDLEIFAGVGDLIKQVVTLQSEISIRPLYDGMPDYITALQVFRDAGFSISGLFPVTRDKRDLTVIEFDCVMVKMQ